jgi:hypothetical protein
MIMQTTGHTPPPHPGRSTLPLGAIAVGSVVLFAASLLFGSLIAGAAFPSPFGTDADVLPYITGQATALQVQGLLQFASAAALAVFAAMTATQLHRLGARGAAATITLAGGVFGGVFGALSALLQWTLSQPVVVAFAPLARAVHYLTFITGGPGNVAGIGLLVLGIALAGWFGGLLPRGLTIVGLVIALIAQLSMFVMLSPALGVLLPIARFPGLLWLIAAGFMLPRGRASVEASPQQTRAPHPA